MPPPSDITKMSDEQLRELLNSLLGIRLRIKERIRQISAEMTRRQGPDQMTSGVWTEYGFTRPPK